MNANRVATRPECSGSARRWPRRTLRSFHGLAAVAAALSATACPLTTFEVEDPPVAGGSGGTSGGNAGSGGVVLAGRGGGSTSGEGGETSAPRLEDDHYAILQGETLNTLASFGVLANDSPLGLRVVNWVSVSPPDGFEVDVNIEPDGGFEFAPSPGFFGLHRVRYRVDGPNAAEATVEFRVVPTGIDLEAVVQGVGGFVIEGAPGDALGVSLSGVDDIDADGLDELVIGAPGSQAGAGAVYLVRGTAGTDPIELGLLASRTTEQRFLSFEGQPGDAAGVSVSGVGDLDDDGAGDLMIGANGGRGRAYVVLTGGLSGGRALTGALGYSLTGDAKHTDVGRVVSGVGDVNGDGVPDVLVSSRDDEMFGWVHVVSGDTLVPSENSGRTRAVAVVRGRSVAGAQPNDAFPLAAAGDSDVDGDGYAEIFLASHSNFVLLTGGTDYPASAGEPQPDGSLGGWSLLRSAPPAPAAVTRAGDVDGDGTADVAYCDGVLYCRVVFGPPSTLASGWTITGFSPGTTKLLVAGGGDIDGDDYADLLFADDEGAFAVYGKPSGHSDLNVSSLRSAGFSLEAPATGMITSVAIAGDLNGDGLADMAIGDASANYGAGRVYVVFGVLSNLDAGPD